MTKISKNKQFNFSQYIIPKSQNSNTSTQNCATNQENWDMRDDRSDAATLLIYHHIQFAFFFLARNK